MVYHPLPDSEARIYGPQRIAAVATTLAQDGVAPAQVLAGSGIDEAALRSPDTRVSYAQVATVFRNAVRLSRDPATALRAGAHMRLTAYGMYGYALLSSSTRADMIAFAVQYHRAMGPVVEISYTCENDVDAYRYEPLLSPDPSDTLYRFALEFTFSAHLTLNRDLHGDSFAFSSLRAVYPQPEHVQAYRQLFQCPLQFGQNVNELQIGGAWSSRAPRLPDLVTHAMARAICQQFLTELPYSSGIVSDVRRVLIEQMPWRFPNVEAMARELSMHSRTLRRRLEAQGTSYRQVLADVRRVLAIDYLRKTHMTNEEIASRLGYSDAANFRHALARWTGKTPHEYRRV